MPEISKPLTPEMKKAYAAMQVLEDVRDPCVRGGKTITKKIVRDVEAAYTTAVTLCQEVIDKAGTEQKKSVVKSSRRHSSPRKTTARKSTSGWKRK